MKTASKKIKYVNVKQTLKADNSKTETRYSPINGEYILQSDPNELIARKIERYLNYCHLLLTTEEAEKLAQLDKMSLGDIIYTLQVEENTQSEIIKYFRSQLKIKVDRF